VRDYARCFYMNTVVLRQSCIYGMHQYGTEDQGWSHTSCTRSSTIVRVTTTEMHSGSDLLMRGT